MIKYVAYYGNKECKEKRKYVLAATNKIDYIAQAISKNDQLMIISLSCSLERKSKAYTIHTKSGVPVSLPPSIGKRNRLRSFIDDWLVRFYLLKNLFFKTRKNDSLIVYHSLKFAKIITFAKFIKRFRLILEVEEIYGDVIGLRKTKKKELKFFKKADAYIFPTQLLDNVVNSEKKPSVIIHGTYCVEESGQPFNDGRIHVVYAGTFDPRKGGVQAAAAAAEFLTGKYHVHILGFGSETDKNNLLKTIEEVSQKTECKVTYDGLKSGEEYIKFIQSCDIGLSTQNPDAAFNATSFPSKILSYMANGLRVVSIRIPAIEQSAIGKYMYYYDHQTPEEIAKSIMQVDLNDGYDSRKIIKSLDERFTREIAELLKKV